MNLTDEELIKRVAEKVMGWNPLLTHIPCKIEKTLSGTKTVYSHMQEWNPLTNLNHTFMVVERMRELGYWMKMSNNIYRHPNTWKVWVNKETPESFQDWVETHASLGHAICMAALKAVENG